MPPRPETQLQPDHEGRQFPTTEPRSSLPTTVDSPGAYLFRCWSGSCVSSILDCVQLSAVACDEASFVRARNPRLRTQRPFPLGTRNPVGLAGLLDGLLGRVLADEAHYQGLAHSSSSSWYSQPSRDLPDAKLICIQGSSVPYGASCSYHSVGRRSIWAPHHPTWGRMAIVDTKPFKLRVILQRIFVERPQVTG